MFELTKNGQIQISKSDAILLGARWGLIKANILFLSTELKALRDKEASFDLQSLTDCLKALKKQSDRENSKVQFSQFKIVTKPKKSKKKLKSSEK